MGSMMPPSKTDPQHFAEGDVVRFGYDADAAPAIVLVAQPDEQGCVELRDLSGWFGDHADRYRTRVSNLLHRHGCQACREFQQAWAAQQDRQWREERADYSPAALELADTLCERGLTLVSSAGRRCGHGDRYVLSADAPLPVWLHTALEGATLTEPEGPWPNWGRTCAPVDWPTLLNQHPDFLVADHDMLEHNFGATWDSIAQAFTLVRAVDPEAHMDVFLWVADDGRIQIAPMGLFASFDLDDATAQRVDDILAAGGRSRDDLHHDDGYYPSRTGWSVSC